MKGKILLITNNFELYKCVVNGLFVSDNNNAGSSLDVLKSVRDYVHKGSVLLTHPLCGNLRPYQQPFRSVLIIDNNDLKDFKNLKIDLNSLEIIENAIMIYSSVKNVTARPALRTINNIKINELSADIYADYAFIDAELMRDSLEQYRQIKPNAPWPRPAELLKK